MRAIWTISVLLVAAGLSVGAGMLMFDFATVEPEFVGLGSFLLGLILGVLSQIGLLMAPFACDRGARRRVTSAILMAPAYLLLGLVAMDFLGRFMRGAALKGTWLIVAVLICLVVYTLSLAILLRPRMVGAAGHRLKQKTTKTVGRRFNLLLGIAVVFC